MFGLTFEKIIIIGVVAAFVIGPERLPHYASVLAKFVRQLRDFTNGAKNRMKEEMGPEFDEVEWKKLDPRQYDPRRIIRDALLEDPEPAAVKPSSPMAPATAGAPDPHATTDPLIESQLHSPRDTAAAGVAGTAAAHAGAAGGLGGSGSGSLATDGPGANLADPSQAIDPLAGDQPGSLLSPVSRPEPAYLARKKNLDRDGAPVAASAPHDSEAT